MSTADLAGYFRRAQAQLDRNSHDAVQKSTDATYVQSQAIVPVATGALRASGEVEIEKTGDGWVGQVAYGNSFPASRYAVKVHEGTVKMTARKFLERPALEQAERFFADAEKAFVMAMEGAA